MYLVQKQGEVDKVILPIYGKGLWSTLYGFVALDHDDLNTIRSLLYYQHGETPGLGGEVDNPSWKALWNGKQAFGADGSVQIRPLKAYASAKPTVTRALKAWKANRRLPFAELWITERQSTALSTFDRERGSETDRGIVWDLVPLHAMTPGDFHRLVELWSRDKKLIIMRRGLKSNQFHDTDRIYLKQQDKKWRIDRW